MQSCQWPCARKGRSLTLASLSLCLVFAWICWMQRHEYRTASSSFCLNTVLPHCSITISQDVNPLQQFGGQGQEFFLLTALDVSYKSYRREPASTFHLTYAHPKDRSPIHSNQYKYILSEIYTPCSILPKAANNATCQGGPRNDSRDRPSLSRSEDWLLSQDGPLSWQKGKWLLSDASDTVSRSRVQEKALG